MFLPQTATLERRTFPDLSRQKLRLSDEKLVVCKPGFPSGLAQNFLANSWFGATNEFIKSFYAANEHG